MIRFHHLHQVAVAGSNQTLKLYRPFTGFGIGIVIRRHEFSVTFR